MAKSRNRPEEESVDGELEGRLLKVLDHIDMRFESLRHDLLVLHRESVREFVSIQNDKLADFEQRLTEIEQQISGDPA